MFANRRLGGLLTRRERWGLSPRGWLALLSTAFLLGLVLFFTIEPFLSVKAPVATDILVVEGWAPEFVFKAAKREFESGNYQKIYTTGGPLAGEGGYTNDFHTSASVGASRLRALGMQEELIEMVPSHVINRDRTYASALALRQRFERNAGQIRAFNLFTENAHARRSRLLFRKAFAGAVTVGVVGVANPDYEASRWWHNSEGVKNVLSEAFAYLYTIIFFHPSDHERISPN